MDAKKEFEPQRVEVAKPVVEMPKSSEQNLEVSSWMEKIEKKFARVPNDTTDVNDDTVVIQPPPQTKQPPVTLPVTSMQMQVGKKAKVELGVAWLVTWVIRQIKLLAKLGKRVKLSDMPEVK